MHATGGVQLSHQIKTLTLGPQNMATKFTGYIINGVRYHTRDREKKRTTQNSGVMLRATTESYASARDQHPISGEVTFYGVLTNIIELCYSKDLKFILFECDWVDNRRGLIEKDSFGFTLVNFTYLLYNGKQLSDEPFILVT